jgi:hypothetical protein
VTKLDRLSIIYIPNFLYYLLFNHLLSITKMTKEEQTKPAEETQKSKIIFIFRGILGRIIKRLRTIRI